MQKPKYEYLLFGVLGEYMGVAATLREAHTHALKAPGVYYYHKQEILYTRCAFCYTNIRVDTPCNCKEFAYYA